jgi:TRAP transporter 4TM/12TM fusion protein
VVRDVIQNSLRSINNFVIAFLFVYQITIIVYQFQGALEFYYFHLGMVQMVVMSSLAREKLATPASPRRNLALILYLCISSIGLVASSYLYWNVNDIELRQPFLESADIWAGAALVCTVTLQVYLVWGRILAGLILASILYFTFGHMVPGRFNYASPELEILISYLSGMGGARGVIWGIPLSANTLFLIIVFGGVMKGTRILELFNEVGKILLNISRGGICYSAILASTAIGMVTGQAVANISLSGSVTIPAMQQRGISKTQAGAIEVVASLGSQLIPPIMGLGGFLIAVNLGIPYSSVALAAIVPAFLFIVILLITTFFMAEAETNLQIQKESVNWPAIKWIAPSFLLSFGVLLVLLYMRYSPGYAAMWALVLLLILAFMRPATFRPKFTQLWDGLKYGVNAACSLALILAGIGIIVQVLVTSGAGFDLGRTIMLISDGSLFPALLLGMGIALLVGLGLPTPAAYALIAIIMIPFLQDVGIAPLTAHFFGFYFAIFSAITPPVAVGVMAASRISGGSFYGTAYQAGRMSLTAILIPYAFVAFPSILAFPHIGWQGFTVSAALIVATIFWGASIYGTLKGRRMKAPERLLLLLGPVLFITLLVSKEMIFALLIFAGLPAFLLWNYYVARSMIVVRA